MIITLIPTNNIISPSSSGKLQCTQTKQLPENWKSPGSLPDQGITSTHLQFLRSNSHLKANPFLPVSWLKTQYIMFLYAFSSRKPQVSSTSQLQPPGRFGCRKHNYWRTEYTPNVIQLHTYSSLTDSNQHLNCTPWIIFL